MLPTACQRFRILEVGAFVAAPTCGRLLAMLGADVIKVEAPQGDRARRYGPFAHDRPDADGSGYFLFLNTNKRGITLDLRTPTGRRLLHRLVRTADVLIHDARPAAAASLGLSSQQLEAIN